MKRTAILLLFFLLITIFLSGCNLINKNQETIKDVNPYLVMKAIDRSILHDKKVELRVFLREKVSTNTLKTYSKEIVSKYKDNYDAILILFYDIQEETLSNISVPLGVAIWGPKGSFTEPIKIGEFNKEDNILVVQRNSTNHEVSDEEKQFYNDYLKYIRENKNDSLEDISKHFNLPLDELNKKIVRVKTRYNEDIKLP